MDNGVEESGQAAAGLVLASGLSRRFGQANKLIVPIGGLPVVRRTVSAYLEARLDPVVVVVGHEWEGVVGALAGLAVVTVLNPDFEQGQSRALVRGLTALPPETQIAVIGVGDQPFLDPRVIVDLLENLQRSQALIAAPRYAGKRGNPVAFSRALLPELLRVQGDVGGRTVIERHRSEVVWVDCGDPQPGMDIDTWEEYRALTGE